jgi:hypothetical protein
MIQNELTVGALDRHPVQRPVTTGRRFAASWSVQAAEER